MNTNSVSKLLGVSPSTIKRWVKQLHLNMERNEHGHFIFSEENIEQLKNIQAKQNNSNNVKDDPTEKEYRYGIVRSDSQKIIENLTLKMNELEKNLEQKADSVVTYQLLQHRREIEELTNQISSLTEHIQKLEKNLNEVKTYRTQEQLLVLDRKKQIAKTNKVKIFTKIFGL